MSKENFETSQWSTKLTTILTKWEWISFQILEQRYPPAPVLMVLAVAAACPTLPPFPAPLLPLSAATAGQCAPTVPILLVPL